MKRALLLAAAVLAAGLVSVSASPAVAGSNGCPPGGHFWGMAHQGAHDTVQRVTTYRNTLPAFRRAEDRCQWVESDVRFTRDGIPVMVHDKSTAPMFRKRCDLIVSDSTLRQIRAACRNPDDSTVATFKQFLKTVDRRGFVELKVGNTSNANLRELIAAVYANRDEKTVHLEYTGQAVLERIARLDRNRRPIQRVWKSPPTSDPDLVARTADYAVVPRARVTRQLVNRLGSRGVRTVAAGSKWVNTWERLASIGVTAGLTEESLRMYRWQRRR